MNMFPVTSSTISASHIGLFIQKKYRLSAATRCKLFRTGINHSYIVTNDDKKFVFRVYSLNWRSELEIAEEIRLLMLLKAHHISVSYPISDRHENYIQPIQAPEGLRFGVLFSYANGNKIRNFSKETSFNLGALMAKIHRVTENKTVKRIEYNPITLTTLPYEYATKYFSTSNEDMEFIMQSRDFINFVFTNLKTKPLRLGVVHLDIWYDNMHINGETDITIFDFDFCGNGWLLYDIAYFIMQLFHAEPDKKVYREKLDSFFEGYESIIKISDEEKALLPLAGLAIWIFYLGVQSQRFENWSNVFLTENYLKRYIGMVKVWLNYNEIEIK